MMSAFKNILTTMLPMAFRKNRLRLYMMPNSFVKRAFFNSSGFSSSTKSFLLRSMVRAKRLVIVSNSKPTPEINATGVIEL